MEAAITGTLAPPTFEESLKTTMGRKMPRTMQEVATRLAGGDTREQIADALEISNELVDDYVEVMVRCLRCQPPQSSGRPTKRPDAANPGTKRFLVEAKCEVCGTRIKKGEERAVLAAFVIDYRRPDDEELYRASGKMTDVAYADLKSVAHYCRSCGVAEEVRVRNPWRLHLTPEQATWMEVCEAEERAESAAMSEHLGKVVADGDMHGFNIAMPTTPNRDDCMSHAKTVSALAAEKANRMDEPASASEIAEEIFSTAAENGTHLGAGSRTAGENAQRAKLREYLSSPKSKGKMLPDERDTAKMWAEGLSENEVARRLHVNQSTVHRRVAAARKKADALR